MSEQLRWDGQTVIVTGAGGALGRAYALFFGSRGANVVVNDLKNADSVVAEIKQNGGKAIPSYDSVDEGEKIVATAMDNFGRLDVLINNAGILQEYPFQDLSMENFNLMIQIHLTGAFKCTKAAWPIFRKQKYGRVINTSSGAGLYGWAEHVHYTAVKTGLIGFTETLAKEGAKYNILCNAIAPAAASPMTSNLLTSEVLNALSPDYLVPLVGALTHPSTEETGGIYEAGGGHYAKLRWERAKGLLLKVDINTYTPGSILAKWKDVCDFSQSEFPSGPADFLTLLEDAQQLPENPKGPKVDLTGRVVIVTGGGNGLGRVYCLLFAKHGARVVVNDLADPMPVVKEIRALGGQAVPIQAPAEEGEKVVKAAIDAYGRVDVVVNNAGILRDKAFVNMTDKEWQDVIRVHLGSTAAVSKAAWPHMIRQKYGRIINTTSPSGIYGNFGQANYATAKAAIIGFSKGLALEGAKHDIKVNTVAPNAGTAMTRTVMPEEIVQALKPEFVAPMVVLLGSDQCPSPKSNDAAGLYEVGSGWQTETRWQRTPGASFASDVPPTVEQLVARWNEVAEFTEKSDNPYTTADGMKVILRNLEARQKKRSGGVRKSDSSTAGADGTDYLAKIEQAKKAKSSGTEFTYTNRDVILYNLGLGAKRTDLPLVYENDDNFHPISSFGVIPPFNADVPYSLDEIVPNFSPMMLLHGEQYLEVRQYPIPTEATLVAYPTLVEVIDKGSAAVVVQGSLTKDKATGRDVFYNESTVFLRGCGGFGGSNKGADRGAATAANKPPSRKPDFVIEETTTAEQAALYRLSGDYNPLHIDPSFAAVGGFKDPILHGLCFFGFATKHIEGKVGRPVKSIKVRFASPVFPGQTLQTEVWKVSEDKVVFQVRVRETGKLCISNGGAEFFSDKSRL